MSEKEHKHDYKRYLKKYKLVETETELPIQGQVHDPKDLHVFMNDLQDDQVPKMIGIYLDSNNLFLGHQVFIGDSAETFDTAMLWHYFFLFLAKKFILLSNHTNDDPTPTDKDIRLMDIIRMESQILSSKPFFEDYVISCSKSYYSMATNEGTACQCGKQVYL